MDPGRILFDQLAGDAVKEILRAVTGTFLCRSTAERLRRTVEPQLQLVQQTHAPPPSYSVPRWTAGPPSRPPSSPRRLLCSERAAVLLLAPERLPRLPSSPHAPATPFAKLVIPRLLSVRDCRPRPRGGPLRCFKI